MNGAQLFRTDFYPEGREDIKALKETYATLWDELDKQQRETTRPEVGRWLSIAKTELETSGMYAVKAYTA